MHRDVPAPAGPLGRGNRGLALEKTFGEEIDDALCGLFVADRKGGAVGAWGEGGSHQSSDHLAKSTVGPAPERARGLCWYKSRSPICNSKLECSRAFTCCRFRRKGRPIVSQLKN